MNLKLGLILAMLEGWLSKGPDVFSSELILKVHGTPLKICSLLQRSISRLFFLSLLVISCVRLLVVLVHAGSLLSLYISLCLAQLSPPCVASEAGQLVNYGNFSHFQNCARSLTTKETVGQLINPA